MALTFSMAYQNTPEDFQARVNAQLQAQSIAIAAALALAAKNADHPNAIDHAQLRVRDLDKTARILPINERDKQFAEAHLSDIFSEARKLLAIEFPWDKASDE
ncbi:hypothetical protein [Comamonas kerstersii]|uniref:hypothetical protein n=1 Tax=Comamonas kerstersii TaxID=225992 RepID=UPI002070FF13|nr:hypothetical protein [Comamonas kerstersii]DAE39905.1 MAG TPA: hypothetical protein [Caudoviricetes sp.]